MKTIYTFFYLKDLLTSSPDAERILPAEIVMPEGCQIFCYPASFK